MTIIFFNDLISNISLYCLDLDYCLLPLSQHNNNSFILWTISRNSIKVISSLYIHHTNISWLSNHQCTQYQSYSFIVLLVYIISTYFFNNKLFLEVNTLNYKGLSIYYWLGCEVIQQKLIFLNHKHICQFQLVNNQKKSKNFWRRFLIITS